MDFEQPWSLHPYEDHVGLWRNELASWVPETIFDAHVHLGRPEAVGAIRPERRNEPLLTFTSLSWEQARAFYPKLYRGKTISGIIAFPFPLREVHLEAANEYIIELMVRDRMIKGFLLSDPYDTGRTARMYEAALQRGVRFYGVKPYYDLLGKSNFETSMSEFIPTDLLEFMNSRKLTMMLHTAGVGMSDLANQNFLKTVTSYFPHITIILAHMGRYVEVRQFFHFLDSDVLDSPSVFLETSSATSAEVYKAVLQRPELRERLLFGSDIPYGLITGVEHWSEDKGAIFISRDDYPWSDRNLQQKFVSMRAQLTYNTYHTIKAIKEAVEDLRLPEPETEQLKVKIFRTNASRLFGDC